MELYLHKKLDGTTTMYPLMSHLIVDDFGNQWERAGNSSSKQLLPGQIQTNLEGYLYFYGMG